MVTNRQLASAANILLPPLPLGGGLGTLQDAIGGDNPFDINTPNSPISNLISKMVAAGGVTRPNKFLVQISMPRGFDASSTLGLDGVNRYQLNDSIVAAEQQVYMACEVSQIPGRSLTTTQSRTYGPVREFVTGKVYPPVDMTFRVHGNMMERRFFEAWQETASTSTHHDSAYPSEYTSKIEISQLGPPELAEGIAGILHKVKGAANILAPKSGFAKTMNIANNAFKKFGPLFGLNPGDQIIGTYVLHEAFPAIIGPLALDHGQNDSYHRQSITFNYRKWTTSLMGQEVSNNILDMVGGAVNSLLGGTVGFGASFGSS